MLTGNAEDSSETAGVKPEEGGDDVKSAWPLCLGLHTCYNGKYRTMQYREVEQIAKICPSSDWRLQFASMKLESLVIADQHAAVNTFLSLVHTARQVMEAGSALSRRNSSVPTARLVTGTKS